MNIAVCKDNDGIEEHFTVGVKYIVVSTYNGLYLIKDNEDNEIEVMQSRFEVSKNLFQEYVEKDGGNSMSATMKAIEELTDEDEIRAFYKSYLNYLKTELDNKSEAEYIKTVNENIGYVLHHFDNNVIQKWFDVLPTITHPIFGRKVVIVPEDALKAGMITGEFGTDSPEINKLKQEKGW